MEREGGRFFFKALKEGDDIVLACDEEVDRQLWVQAIYRATGQTHKPVPPTMIAGGKGANAIISRLQGGKSQLHTSCPNKMLHLLTVSFCNIPNIITHVTSIFARVDSKL